MNPKLIIEAAKLVRMAMDQKAFKTDTHGNYLMDNWAIPRMDLVSDDIPEGFRQVAVHVVPYTVVEGKNVYYIFQTSTVPEVFVSFPIGQDDFVGKSNTDQTMSLCRTIIGKVIQVFDQPHLEMTLDTENFKFPALVNGEFVWALEVKGESHQSVDELVAQLGTIVGRITYDEVKDVDGLVGKFSKKVMTPIQITADDITIE